MKALLRGITNALLRVLLRQSPESIMILLKGSPEGDTKCSPEGVFCGGLLRGLLNALLRGIPNALMRGWPEGIS